MTKPNNSCCEKCSGYFPHTIGSHSDDRGGDSDYPCYCNENNCRNPKCECHKPNNSWENRLGVVTEVDSNGLKTYIVPTIDGNKIESLGQLGDFITKTLQQQREDDLKVTGETSDGYHTFNELYEFRKLYNAVLFNTWASGHKQGFAVKYDVHKSKKHNDGEDCFGGGWFIVMAEMPTGQISNHYELKDWDLFDIPEKEKANKWDGHTAQDVANRLLQNLKQENNETK